MRTAQLVLFGGYLLLTIVVFVFVYQFTSPTNADAESWRLFAMLAGIGLTSTTSLYAAAASVTTTVFQQKELEGLEKLKQRLQRLPDAQFALRQSADKYYHAIAELETGKYNCEKITVAEDLMESNAAYRIYLGDQTESWYKFWQCGRYICESAVSGDSSKERDKNRALWHKEAAEFGKKFKEINDALED